jgi:hypothetical protein
MGVVLGAVAGMLVTGACLFVAGSLWSWLAERWADPSPTAVGAATASARPSDTPAPALTAAASNTPAALAVEPFLRELTLPTPTASAPGISDLGGTGSLPIGRLSLQSQYEAQGFDFQQTELGDQRDRWVAASPDGLALVEIVGAEQVEEASVIAFRSRNADTAAAARQVVYMLTMMNAILPGWSAGAEWFSSELVKSTQQAGDYASAIVYDGVRTEFSVDGQLGALTLSFRPE